jgi:hypothetical protein
MAPSHRGVLTRRHALDKLHVYVGCRSDSGSGLLNAASRDAKENEALATIFQEAVWECEPILGSLKDADDFCERLELMRLDTWSKGRVVPDAEYGDGDDV